MKYLRIIIFLLPILIPTRLMADSKEIPFTLEDRDRIIRTEQKVDAVRNELTGKFDAKIDGLRSEMNARFEVMDNRFDQLFNFLWAIIGIFTTMMVAVFGFAFWDRKLSLNPLRRENAKILEALKSYSAHQPKLREILRDMGIL